MKVFISADIEGITGTSHWDETNLSKPEYTQFQEQMTNEVVAACQGAINSGATQILVKDAHASGRNIIAAKLPIGVQLLRGWSGHPFSMVEGLDESFQAAMMIGYHSRAGMNSNPLAHTMTGKVAIIRINECYASEFLIHAYAAALKKVPVVFVSGDQGLCDEIKTINPEITTCAVKFGVGNSTNNLHPQVAVQKIQEGVEKALQGDLSKCLVQLPDYFAVEIVYRSHVDAYGASFYPGARLKEPFILQYETSDYFDVLRLLAFIV